jgi:hypothetical protein
VGDSLLEIIKKAFVREDKVCVEKKARARSKKQENGFLPVLDTI